MIDESDVMDTVFITDKNGKRRLADLNNCEHCNIEYAARRQNGRRSRFCSPRCRNGHSRSQVSLVCHTCGALFSRAKCKLGVAKHGHYFCSRSCKEHGQSLAGNCPEIRPAHYGTSEGRELCRTLIARSDAPQCAGCNATERYLLVVHHKDGNKNNNVMDNFEIVCGNCHIKRHLKLVDGQWVYDPKSLTPRERLNDL